VVNDFSLNERTHEGRTLLNIPYIDLDDNWCAYVNEPIYVKELTKIRNSVNRQAPLGNENLGTQNLGTQY